MGELKFFELKNSDIGKDFFIRLDYDYFENMEIFHNKIKKFKKFIKFRDAISFLENGKPIEKSDYAEEVTSFIHIVPRNIKEDILNLNSPIYIKDKKGEELKDFKLEKNDIIISISANVGESFLFKNNEDTQYTLSHYTLRVKANSKVIDPKILVYYLNHKITKYFFRAVETGKTQKNLSKLYLYNLLIPKIDYRKQKKIIVPKLNGLEKDIVEIKNKIKPITTIIDNFFSFYFNINVDKLKKELQYFRKDISLKDLWKSDVLRLGVRYHSPVYEDVLTIINNLKEGDKKYLPEIIYPIFTGERFKADELLKEISSKEEWEEYCEKDDIAYIHGKNINEGNLFISNIINLNNKNINKNLYLEHGDIMIGRVGATTSVAIFNLDVPAVPSDNVFVIRLKDKNKDLINYITYFLTSILGRIQLISLSKEKEQPVLNKTELSNLIIFIHKNYKELSKKISEELKSNKKLKKGVFDKRREIDDFLLKNST